jgi:putative colanic acid biosynthesis glycosyltransferase
MKGSLEIITVCFNDLNNLKETYRTLSQQSNLEFKWKVIDGASVDGTLDFLKKIKPKFNFSFISEKDSGIYNAMNKGITQTSSEFLWFLNSGDTCFSDSVTEKIKKATIQSDAYLHLFPVKVDAGQSSFVTSTKIGKRELLFNMPVCHQGIIYNKKVFTETGLFADQDFKIAADHDHLCRCYKTLKDQFQTHQEVIANYKGGGVSEANALKTLKELKKSNAKNFDQSWPTYCQPIYIKKLISAARHDLLKAINVKAN